MTFSFFSLMIEKENYRGNYKKFISILEELSVRSPPMEALQKMPGSMKSMKDLVTKKRTLSFKVMDNVPDYSAIDSRSLVEKK